MADPKHGDATRPNTAYARNLRERRVFVYGAVLLAAFLLGLIPMWMRARERARERDNAQIAVRISGLQNTLANAAIDARRGEYESGRQAASQFFTTLRTEIERGRDSAFDVTQQNKLRPLLSTRDDTITLLARSDPASWDRLIELYNAYRQAIGNKSPQ